MSLAVSEEAATLIARGLRRVDPDLRAFFLQETLTHAAAALQIYRGEEFAAETVYRLGDTIVAPTADVTATQPDAAPDFRFRAKPLRS